MFVEISDRGCLKKADCRFWPKDQWAGLWEILYHFKQTGFIEIKGMKYISRWRYWNRSRRFAKKRETQECLFVSNFLKEGDTAVDIGANKGALTYLFSHLVGRSGAVYAFEPQPEMITELTKMAAAVRFKNISVHPIALSDSPGEALLHVPSDHTCGSLETQHAGQKLTVRLERLDEYLDSFQPGGPIDFIKCDVEGHELPVFQGAIQTLQQHRPLLLFESFSSNKNQRFVNPVFDLLLEQGYEGFAFCGQGLKKLDSLGVQHDCYNFVFLHRQRHSLRSLSPPYDVQPPRRLS